MIIEDEEKTGKILKEELEDEGFQVDWFQDGIGIDKKIHANQFDLLILDFKLPRLDGDVVLKTIRKIDPYIQVLIYTNYEDMPAMKNFINLKADGFLNKGAKTDLNDIIKKVKELLSPPIEDDYEKALKNILSLENIPMFDPKDLGNIITL